MPVLPRSRFSDVGACPYNGTRPPLPDAYHWWPNWTQCDAGDWSGQRWLSRAPPAKMAGKPKGEFKLPRDGE